LDHPEVRPGVVNLMHTEVDPSLGGQGIAGKITQAVADRLREKGLKAELSCSYSSDMLPPLSLTLRSGGFLFDSPIGLSISRLSPRAPRFFLSPQG